MNRIPGTCFMRRLYTPYILLLSIRFYRARTRTHTHTLNFVCLFWRKSFMKFRTRKKPIAALALFEFDRKLVPYLAERYLTSIIIIMIVLGRRRRRRRRHCVLLTRIQMITITLLLVSFFEEYARLKDADATRAIRHNRDLKDDEKKKKNTKIER